MNRASAIKFKATGKLILYSVSTIKGGGGIASNPYITLNAPYSETEIFRGLKKVLSESKMNVANPKNSERTLNQYLHSLGLKDHRSLYVESLFVSILNKDGLIIFSPSENKGIKEGFIHLWKERIEVIEGDDEEIISQAFLDALDKCS